VCATNACLWSVHYCRDYLDYSSDYYVLLKLHDSAGQEDNAQNRNSAQTMHSTRSASKKILIRDTLLRCVHCVLNMPQAVYGPKKAFHQVYKMSMCLLGSVHEYMPLLQLCVHVEE
jgi:hypothetical protein